MTVVEVGPDRFAEIDAVLEERIYEFNAAATGYHDAREFAAVIQGPASELIAGATGFTWGRCCFLDKLWVDPSARRQGLGSSLLCAVEALALERGCRQVVLSSHTFQAPAFYRRHGYVEHGRIDGYPAGHADIQFVKALSIVSSSSPTARVPR